MSVSRTPANDGSTTPSDHLLRGNLSLKQRLALAAGTSVPLELAASVALLGAPLLLERGSSEQRLVGVAIAAGSLALVAARAARRTRAEQLLALLCEVAVILPCFMLSTVYFMLLCEVAVLPA